MTFPAKPLFLPLALAALFATAPLVRSTDAPPATTANEATPPAADAFAPVDLDRLIESEIEAVARFQGRRTMKNAAPVGFVARVKRLPEERKLTYVYTALELSGVRPLPEVGHRMFVETAEGRIIPVYVEKKAAAKIAGQLAEGRAARFLGYHLYSHAKGPALLVVDFAPGELPPAKTGEGKN